MSPNDANASLTPLRVVKKIHAFFTSIMRYSLFALKMGPNNANAKLSIMLNAAEVEVGEVDDGGEFLFVMFNDLEDVGVLVDADGVGEGGGDVLVVHGDEASEGHAGKGEGAHGFVDLGEVFGEETGLVGVLHEVFDIVDDVVDVEKFSTLQGGGVADAGTFEVEAVLESVEVAGLASPASFGRIVV